MKTAAGEQDESFGCRTHRELAGRGICSWLRTSLAKIGNTDHKECFVAESASHKRKPDGSGSEDAEIEFLQGRYLLP